MHRPIAHHKCGDLHWSLWCETCDWTDTYRYGLRDRLRGAHRNQGCTPPEVNAAWEKHLFLAS